MPKIQADLSNRPKTVGLLCARRHVSSSLAALWLELALDREESVESVAAAVGGRRPQAHSSSSSLARPCLARKSWSRVRGVQLISADGQDNYKNSLKISLCDLIDGTV
jgi:hypothetical protein